MNTFHIDRKLRTWRRGLGLFAVSLAVTSSTLLAQEPEMRWVPEEKARIGVLLEDLCEAPPTAESACDRPPVVSSVVNKEINFTVPFTPAASI